MLESLAIKIYETDTTKVLRSLAHGIDACASYEGVSNYCFLSNNICKCYFVVVFAQSQFVFYGQLLSFMTTEPRNDYSWTRDTVKMEILTIFKLRPIL